MINFSDLPFIRKFCKPTSEEIGVELQKKIDDGTIANMTIEDAIITGDKLADNAGEGLVKEVGIKNLFNKANVVNDKYLIENGAETSETNYSYGTDYIPIDMTKTYAFTGCYGKNQQILLYDENKTYVGTVYKDKCTGTAGKSLTCDFSTLGKNTAKFARVNTTTGKLDVYMFIQADTYPSEYIEYGIELPLEFKDASLSTAINNMIEDKLPNDIFIGEEVTCVYQDQVIAIGKGTPRNKDLACVAIGFGALQNNTEGDGTDDQAGKFNVVVGNGAGNANTTGNHLTFVGFQAGRNNTTGTGVTAIGEDACIANTKGNGNVGVGRYSLFKNKESSDNVAVGLNASYLLEAGKNTAIGSSAGRSNISGEGCTYLGYYANGNDGLTNATAIGNQAYVKESNAIQLGNSDVKKVYTWGDIQSQRNGAGIILLSPNGTKYKLTVANDGTLTTTLIN